MAGDWIKIRCGLVEDPDVIRIAAATGLDEFEVVGRLVKLWTWADQHVADGHASGVTAGWLDRYVGCDDFAAALVTVGWLAIESDQGLEFPDFESHNGHNAKKRAQAQKRQQKHRANQHGQADPSHAERDGERDAGSDGQRDKSATREEERREDLDPPLTPPRGGNGGNRRRRKKAAQRGLPTEDPGTF